MVRLGGGILKRKTEIGLLDRSLHPRGKRSGKPRLGGQRLTWGQKFGVGVFGWGV